MDQRSLILHLVHPKNVFQTPASTFKKRAGGGGGGAEQHKPNKNSNGLKGNRNIGPFVCLVKYTYTYKPFLASYIYSSTTIDPSQLDRPGLGATNDVKSQLKTHPQILHFQLW